MSTARDVPDAPSAPAALSGPLTASAAHGEGTIVADSTQQALGALTEAVWWRRLPWLIGGVLSLLLGIIGIFLPLLPTTPFVLLAAFCFARGSARYEAWLIGHPRFGPVILQWRATRAIPLRAKQLAWTMMAISAGLAAWFMPVLPWLPAVCCLGVGVWMWRLPTAPPAGPAVDAGSADL